MAERHPRFECQQTFGLDGLSGRFRYPQQPGRPPDEREITRRVRCRDEQQALRVGGQCHQPPREAVHHLFGHR